MNEKKDEHEIVETSKAALPSGDPAPWGGAHLSAGSEQAQCEKSKRRPHKSGEDERC